MGRKGFRAAPFQAAHCSDRLYKLVAKGALCPLLGGMVLTCSNFGVVI
ncbi:hypothetical protein L3Q82_013708, partial [Scortum barcoo]